MLSGYRTDDRDSSEDETPLFTGWTHETSHTLEVYEVYEEVYDE